MHYRWQLKVMEDPSSFESGFVAGFLYARKNPDKKVMFSERIIHASKKLMLGAANDAKLELALEQQMEPKKAKAAKAGQ